MEKKRYFWLDVARCLAIIMISMNHAINRTYDNYHNQYHDYISMSFFASLFKSTITVISHTGVPIFLMITGSLILKKDFEKKDQLKRFYSSNYKDLLITTELWYIIMFFSLVVVEGRSALCSATIVNLFETLFFVNQTTFDSMWYMPMILCVYTVLPIVALALKHLPKMVWTMPLGITLYSFVLVPNVNSILQLFNVQHTVETSLNYANVFSGFLLYIIMGFWISNGLLKRIKTIYIVLGFSASLFVSVGFQLIAYSQNTINYLLDYNFITILLLSGFLFELIRRFFSSDNFEKPYITYISNISFALYFIHICIMSIINKVLMYTSVGGVIKFCILEFGSMFISVIIVMILSKSQLLKHYLLHIK